METLHVSRQASEKAAVRTSGLVKLVFFVKARSTKRTLSRPGCESVS